MLKLRFPKFNIWALLIAFFPIAHVFAMNVGALSVLSNYDEALSLVAFVIVILLLICNRLTRYDTFICISLTLITVLGIISNLASSLVSEWFPIAIDVLWLWKPFAVYIVFKYIAFKKKQREKILLELTDFSKFIIFFVLFVCIVGQFVDIGVVSYEEKVFGVIKQFMFFWDNAIQTGWLVIGALMVLSATVEKKIFYRYFAISVIPLVLTGSSMVYCWIAIMAILIYTSRAKYKFKFWHLLVLAPIVIGVNYSDFRTYLLEESVRKTFFEKGIMLANQYFPLGSGFATFGSEMARRYYSQLYISWGWENDWALNPDSGFLSDNFFASIIGQFGWIAMALYAGCLVLLFMQANNKVLERNERLISIATALTLAITMIGSATAKSMMGIFIFALLGVLSAKTQSQYDGIKLKG